MVRTDLKQAKLTLVKESVRYERVPVCIQVRRTAFGYGMLGYGMKVAGEIQLFSGGIDSATKPVYNVTSTWRDSVTAIAISNY